MAGSDAHLCQGNGPGLENRPQSNLPDSFVELDGKTDNLVIAQSPLLLLQDLAAVLIGAVGDCRGRQLRGVGQR